MKTLLLGTNKSDLRSKLQKNIETSVFGISVAWNSCNTAFGTKQILPSQHVSSVNPKKQLKLVCLALVWLGAHENTALGTNKGWRLKKQISRLPYLHCFQDPVGHAGLTRWVAVG